MNNAAKLALIGVFFGIGAWWVTRKSAVATQAESYFQVITDSVTDTVSDLTGGFFLKTSNMRSVKAAQLNNKNVQAFLKVIRSGEGTGDTNGYRRIFGGQLFTGWADHPRITVKKSGYTSSAAGAYQFIISTWDETKGMMGLVDFSPASQDLAALGRIAARGALDDVLAGRFELAVKKCAREWASLPFSPYGQPTITLQSAQNTYVSNGGIIALGDQTA